MQQPITKNLILKNAHSLKICYHGQPEKHKIIDKTAAIIQKMKIKYGFNRDEKNHVYALLIKALK